MGYCEKNELWSSVMLIAQRNLKNQSSRGATLLLTLRIYGAKKKNIKYKSSDKT
jgi:hypothetical protein